MKKLGDFSDYIAKKQKLEDLQKTQSELIDEREKIASQLRTVNMGVNAQALALLNDEYIDTTALSRQLAEIDQSIHVHEEAIKLQRGEVDHARSLASAEISREARPGFVLDIEKILNLLKQLCQVQASLINRRNELEQSGVETGSIPFCLIQRLGSWDNQETLGFAQVYRNWIKQNFPEARELK